MKLRYIIGSLLSALFFTACSDDKEIGSLDHFSVDQTYVSIPAAGGDVSINVTADGHWQFEKVYNVGTKDAPDYRETPAWLSADVLSGVGGHTKVTFHADATDGGRDAELQISVGGGQTQFIMVRQGSIEAKTATIAEVLSNPAGHSYRVTGVITGWYGSYEQYGNFYIKDATGEILVYGAADKDGKLKNYPVKSWGLELGDEVTVEGGTSEYKGVNQFVDVTIIEVKKGLLQVITPAPTLSKTGGQLEVKVAFKGNGAYFAIGDDAKDWVTFVESKYVAGVPTLFESNPSDTCIFKFSVAPNVVDAGEAPNRTGSITFSSYSGKNSTETLYSITQLGDITNATVAEFLSAATGEGIYRLTGAVTDYYYYKDAVSGFYIADYSGKTMVYKPSGFAGTEVKPGDIITVTGQRGEYNGTPQMTNGKIEEVKYAVSEISIADFLTQPDNNNVYYKVTGIITSLLDSSGKENDYGNMYISDGTNELYVYGCYPGYGATGDFRKGFIKAAGIEVGDKITIVGYKSTYKELIELCGGIYLSHEKGTR